MLDGGEVGPVVGCIRESDGSLELDPSKHGAGEFVEELLKSKLLSSVEKSGRGFCVWYSNFTE